MNSETAVPPSSRRGRPPRGSEHAATERILVAAKSQFLEDGVEATSVDSIVAVAGISKKTFYTRFASKADVFDAVCRRFVDNNVPTIVQEGNKDGPAGERLHRIALSLLSLTLEPETVAFQRMMIAESLRHPEMARAAYEAALTRILSVIERCLREGVQRREIDVEDPGLAANYFVAVTIRASADRAVRGLDPPGLGPESKENVRRAVDFFLRSCRVSV